jgi:hypothetical protein
LIYISEVLCKPAVNITLVTVALGKTVTLPCHTELEKPVDWTYRTFKEIVNKYVYSIGELTDAYKYKRNNRFYVDKSVRGDYNLIIRNVQLNDSGIYTCTEEGGHGHRHQPIGLNVSGKFSFVNCILYKQEQESFVSDLYFVDI